MNEKNEKLFKIFTSNNNVDYIYNLIVRNIITKYPEYQTILLKYIKEYKENMKEIQLFVFNDIKELKNSKKSNSNNSNNSNNVNENNSNNVNENNINEKIIELNKNTIIKFEYILYNDLLNKDLLNKSTVIPIDRKKIPDNISEIDTETERIELLELCSDNAIKFNGQYTFQYFINDIVNININKIYIKYNLYNINDYNNKFYLIEQQKIPIIIPIGMYNIDSLTKVITESINNTSKNRYQVYNNNNKNKICFKLQKNEKFKEQETFGLVFCKDLQEMLGFIKSEYYNSNVYIAEKFHDVEIFNNLYIKLYINGKELRKYKTSSKNFFYFESIDMTNCNGKKCNINLNGNPFEINNELNMEKITIQFDNSYTSVIKQDLDFKLLLEITTF